MQEAEMLGDGGGSKVQDCGYLADAHRLDLQHLHDPHPVSVTQCLEYLQMLSHGPILYYYISPINESLYRKTHRFSREKDG